MGHGACEVAEGELEEYVESLKPRALLKAYLIKLALQLYPLGVMHDEEEDGGGGGGQRAARRKEEEEERGRKERREEGRRGNGDGMESSLRSVTEPLGWEGLEEVSAEDLMPPLLHRGRSQTEVRLRRRR